MNFFLGEKRRSGPPTFNNGKPEPKRRRVALISPSRLKQRNESLRRTEKGEGNELSERNKTEMNNGKSSSYQEEDDESEQSSESKEIQNINMTKQKHSNKVLASVCVRYYNIDCLLTFAFFVEHCQTE